MGNIYGYIRVSSKDQNEDRQLTALEPYHIKKSDLYIDKQSGKDFNRPAYKKMIRKLKAGDVVIVKSIDRLGRNYKEILKQWRSITKDKGVDIIVIDMPLLDTTRNKDLLGTFISDIVLQLLSFVSENERENISQRQAEGIAAAKLRGVKFGRPQLELNEDFHIVLKDWEEKKINAPEAAARMGISIRSFYYRLEKYRKEKESMENKEKEMTL